MADYKVKVKFIPDTAELERAIAKVQKDVSVGKTFAGPAGGGAPAGGGISGSIKGAATPSAGMLAGIAAPLGMIAAGIGAVVGAMVFLNSQVKKGVKALEDAAPAFKASRDIQKKMLDLAMLPMANVMTLLMKPYLRLQLLTLRKAMTEARPILERVKSGEITPAEGAKELEPVFKKTVESMLFWNQQIELALKPLASAMAGFTAGMEIIYNTWASGWKDWISNFLESLATGLPHEEIPEYAKEIIDNIQAGVIEVDTATKNLVDDLETTFDNIPWTLRDGIIKYFFTEEGREALKQGLIRIAEKIGDWGTSLWDEITSGGGVISKIGGGLKKAWEWGEGISSTYKSAIGGAAGTAWDFVSGGAKELIGEPVQKGIKTVSNFLTDTLVPALEDTGTAVWNAVTSFFGGSPGLIPAFYEILNLGAKMTFELIPRMITQFRYELTAAVMSATESVYELRDALAQIKSKSVTVTVRKRYITEG